MQAAELSPSAALTFPVLTAAKTLQMQQSCGASGGSVCSEQARSPRLTLLRSDIFGFGQKRRRIFSGFNPDHISAGHSSVFVSFVVKIGTIICFHRDNYGL